MKQNTASQRIASEIRARIRSGQLAPGDRVPSAREIVRRSNVALATATKVLAILRREGLVRPKPGIGTIVRGERTVDLSRERIVRAAIAMADDEGAEAVTMRSLGRELGVATMSLYRHVTSREALLLMMADAAFAEDPPPPRGAKTWRKQLEAIARVEWAGYRRHPWLAHVISISRPQALPSGMRHTEAVLEAMADTGLPAKSVLRLGVMLIAYVRGMAASLEQDARAQEETGLTSDEWMKAEETVFAPLVAKLPTLARLAKEADVDMSLDVLFEQGLRALLDGIDVRARGARSDRR